MVDIDKYPILNQQQALRTFSARFQKNCGSDDLCQAQLIVKPSLADKNAELARSNDGIYQLELGTLPDNLVILHVSVQNLGEAAYEAKLGLSFPASISFVGLAEKSDIADITVVNSTFINIDLGNPFKGRTEKGINSLELKIKFAPKSIINETLIIFEFVAETSSELVVDSSTFLHCVIVRRAEVEIVGRGLPSTLFYGGTVRGESALRDVSEIGPQLKHIFQVSNKGPSEVDVVTIKLKWPYQMENGKAQGKWLLYLTEYPLLKNGKGDCTLPPGYMPNPLNLTHKSENLNYRSYSQLTESISRPVSNTGQIDTFMAEKFQSQQGSGLLNEVRRRRREVEHIVAPMMLRGAGGEEQGDLVVRLDCDRGTAKCLTITCQVYNLQARDNVVVEVRSRLWNSTLVEDYTNIDRVEIVSKASVIIDSVYTQDLTNDFESILTIALPERQLEPIHSMDWWIYVVAAAVGLLVLVLIVLVLYKLGFFRRQRPLDDDTDYMVSGNFEKVHLNSDM